MLMLRVMWLRLMALMVLLGVAAESFAQSAPASIGDVATLVSFTSVVSALFIVAGTVVAVLVTIRGIRWLFALVRR